MSSGMKVFISGQLNEKVKIREAFDKFEEVGATVTHDWTRTDDLSDYRANAEESARRAAADIDGVLAADIYILMSDNLKCGKGMYVELGAALAISEQIGGLRIYVVGPMNHESIFYHHPNVSHRDTLDEVIHEVLDRSLVGSSAYPES